MNKLKYLVAPALALGALSMAAAPASAHADDTWSFQTTLNSVNNSGATGNAVVELHGNQATVTVNVSGAAALAVAGSAVVARRRATGAR